MPRTGRQVKRKYAGFHSCYLQTAKVIVRQFRQVMLGVDLLNKDWPVEYDARLTETIAETIEVEVNKVLERRDALREALILILPLAKGYAAEHPVGSNQAFVNAACDELRVEHEGEPNYGY